MGERDDAVSFGGYLMITGAFFASAMLLVASFTMAIDPLGVFAGSPRVYGFNRLKIERMTRDRLVKPYDSAAIEADVIVFGTSRVKRGMDPKAWNGAIYNAGMDASSTREMRDLLAFYLWRGARPKLVLVETMVYQFATESSFQSQRRPGEPLRASWSQRVSDWLAMTLSYDALRLSYSTVLHNHDQPYAYTTTALGYAPGFPGHSGVDFAGKDWSAYVSSLYGVLTLDQTAMSDLEAIAALCAAHGIELRFFAAPMHPITLLPVWSRGGREFYAAWLQRVGNIAPLYSFMLYDEAWDKLLSDPKPAWSDSSHFTPLAGAVMLRDLLGATPTVATRIDRHTIGAHLDELGARVQAWTLNNPNFLF